MAEKPFKRDLEKSRQQLLDLDSKYQLNSKGRFHGRPDYLHVDNTNLSPTAVAETIIDTFGLQRIGASTST